MDEIVTVVMSIVIALFITIIVFGVVDYYNEACAYIYECVDYNGKIVYCTDAYISRGGMFGTLEDGTKVTLKSYKRVLKEGRYVNGL